MRRLLEICFSKVGKAEEPENSLRNSLENAEPSTERRGFNLGMLVSLMGKEEGLNSPCIID